MTSVSRNASRNQRWDKRPFPGSSRTSSYDGIGSGAGGATTSASTPSRKQTSRKPSSSHSASDQILPGVERRLFEYDARKPTGRKPPNPVVDLCRVDSLEADLPRSHTGSHAAADDHGASRSAACPYANGPASKPFHQCPHWGATEAFKMAGMGA